MKPPTVEHGIPMPPPAVGPKYPWFSMNVGESFLLNTKQKWLAHTQVFLHSTYHYSGPGFAIRKTADGLRVWRVW